MCSQVSKWWNDDRIMWYKRAAENSSFHKSISSYISRYITSDESIAELGCGLGYFTNEMDMRGYQINGYDIDNDAISFARNNFKKNIYTLKDCFSSDISADIAICIFFGKITHNDNFEKLSNIARKKLIYITGGGSERHIPTCEIDTFLKDRNTEFEKEETTIPFHQPFIDLDEAEQFLSTYYKGTSLEGKRRMIHPTEDERYRYILENNKKLTIYIIQKGGNE